MLPFRAFIHEPNDLLTISNGVTTVTLGLEDFWESEPDYTLPPGVRGVNYEARTGPGAAPIYHLRQEGGAVAKGQFPNPEYEAYIEKVLVYLHWLAARESPFYQVDDLARAKIICLQQISLYFDRLANEDPDMARWTKVERETWEMQYQQALACKADPEALTPLLDELVLDSEEGETREDLADSILANRRVFEIKIGQTLKQKRLLTHQVDLAQSLEELRALLTSLGLEV